VLTNKIIIAQIGFDNTTTSSLLNLYKEKSLRAISIITIGIINGIYSESKLKLLLIYNLTIYFVLMTLSKIRSKDSNTSFTGILLNSCFEVIITSDGELYGVHGFPNFSF
jgi:hypothetical protein